MRKTIYCMLVLFCAAKLHAQCNPSPSNIFTYWVQQTKYEIVKEKLTWAGAAACAKQRGAMLIEINSKIEQDTLVASMLLAGITLANTMAPDGGGASYVWTGGNDIDSEGVWVWNGNNDSIGLPFWLGDKTGSAVAGRYTNWGNEPDNYNNQDALGFALTDWPFGVASQWNDISTSNQLYYVLEYPTPTALEEMPERGWSFYPNPAHDILSVEITLRGLRRYFITDLTGRIAQTDIFDPAIGTIQVAALTPGMYLLHFEGGSGNVRFIRQ